MMMKELEAFTYSISDDMRGPLRAIDGFSRVLVEEYEGKLDKEGKRLVEIIATNARGISELIDGLLTFSRLGRQPLEQTDVNMKELAKSAFDEIQAGQRDRHIELDLKDLPQAFGDRAMIRQVLYNLLSNAFKFTRPKQDAMIEIGSRTDGDRPMYYVRDNGVGFDMQYSKKLFGVFQRLHNVEEFEGAGVGLALVQRIVLRHGGRVWAEGKPNEGATFYFSLTKA
jgi:two-component system sensor kinase